MRDRTSRKSYRQTGRETLKIRGFLKTAYRTAGVFSSQGRYNHFDTCPYSVSGQAAPLLCHNFSRHASPFLWIFYLLTHILIREGITIIKKLFLGWAAASFPNYIASFAALGAEIVRDKPAHCDALLLPGGGDIHPRFYGQSMHGSNDVNEDRDEYELTLYRRFFHAGKPILGICRGAQLINVALGGTLRQHIDNHSQVNGVDRIHFVRTDDMLLRSLYGSRFAVNSAHHQAVDRPGAGLHVIARAEDGVIEALRHETRPILAVQWHPERFGPEGARLLAAFLEMGEV